LARSACSLLGALFFGLPSGLVTALTNAVCKIVLQERDKVMSKLDVGTEEGSGFDQG
jgi:hypothetical protein